MYWFVASRGQTRINSNLSVANLCRGIARVITVLLIPMIAFYAFFVGMQILGGGGNVPCFLLYLLFALAIVAGLLVAWRKEYEGAVITILAIAGFLSRGLLFADFRGMLGETSPLAGLLHLLFALTILGYHLDMHPLAKWVPLLSWLLMIVPAVLFLVSWRLRKNLPQAAEAIPPEIPDEVDDKKLKSMIVNLLREGLDNGKIAEKLGITSVHASLLTSALMKQYGVNNREELIAQL